MTDERIIAYLLKELPEVELEQFEDECFAQESWPSHINLVEEDLIDDYLRNELSPERRQRFEHNYLTTDARQKRVRMAAALLRHVDERAPDVDRAVVTPPSGQRWFNRFRTFWSSPNRTPQVAAALLAVFIVGGAWWFSNSRQAAPAHTQVETFETLVLNISYGDRAAGVEADRAKLPRNGSGLKIVLTLPQRSTTATHYRVQLENEDGEIKLSEKAVPENQSVVVKIPARLLARGRYAAKLFAVETDGTEQRIGGQYYFDVE
jgi:hypothetical protein